MSEAKDSCPNWADRKIIMLRDMEIRAGNLLDEAAMKGFYSQDAERLQRQLNHSVDDNLLAEALFAEICRGLVAEGFAHAQIAAFINQRLSANGSLPYCDAAEVAAALQLR